MTTAMRLFLDSLELRTISSVHLRPLHRPLHLIFSILENYLCSLCKCFDNLQAKPPKKGYHFNSKSSGKLFNHFSEVFFLLSATSQQSIFMAAPPIHRPRSRTFTDAEVANFFYTILKQLDLRPVDWALVASTLGISNGHAARMRFTRLKQQREGIQTQHRGPRNGVTRKGKRGGKGKVLSDEEDGGDAYEELEVKEEVKMEGEIKIENERTYIEEKVKEKVKKEGETMVKAEPGVSTPGSSPGSLFAPSTLYVNLDPDPDTDAAEPLAKKIKLEHDLDDDPESVIIVQHPVSVPTFRRSGRIAPSPTSTITSTANKSRVPTSPTTMTSYDSDVKNDAIDPAILNSSTSPNTTPINASSSASGVSHDTLQGEGTAITKMSSVGLLPVKIESELDREMEVDEDTVVVKREGEK